MRAPFDVIQSVGVFQGAFLAAIPDYIPHAHNTDQTIRQNLTLALFYNIAAVPLPF
jgi:cation transport ATPase